MILGIKVTLPIRTVSRNRVRGLTRGAMIAHAKRQAYEHRVAFLAVNAHLRARGLTGAQLAPVVVKLTRISAGKLDVDNAVACAKWVQDGICEALGIDDGDDRRIRFVYAQRKGKRREYGVEIMIERDSPPATTDHEVCP